MLVWHEIMYERFKWSILLATILPSTVFLEVQFSWPPSERKCALFLLAQEHFCQGNNSSLVKTVFLHVYISTDCPSEWEFVDGLCYGIVHLENKSSTSQAEAELACQGVNGRYYRVQSFCWSMKFFRFSEGKLHTSEATCFLPA